MYNYQNTNLAKQVENLKELFTHCKDPELQAEFIRRPIRDRFSAHIWRYFLLCSLSDNSVAGRDQYARDQRLLRHEPQAAALLPTCTSTCGALRLISSTPCWRSWRRTRVRCELRFCFLLDVDACMDRCSTARGRRARASGRAIDHRSWGGRGNSLSASSFDREKVPTGCWFTMMYRRWTEELRTFRTHPSPETSCRLWSDWTRSTLSLCKPSIPTQVRASSLRNEKWQQGAKLICFTCRRLCPTRCG